MAAVNVKHVVLGEGRPKIIVSLMGRDVQEVHEEAQYYREHVDFDIVELRADYLDSGSDPVQAVSAVQALRAVMPDKPILFTFRSAQEGGELEIEASAYFDLNKAVVATGLVDLVDLELFMANADVMKPIVAYVHTQGVKTVLSNHDFSKTPPKDEIVRRLCTMRDLGADILKVAVMPQNPQDVLVLLAATAEMQAQPTRPLITMSMGKLGIISRLSGEVFGSCATFGAAKKASAPGQVDAHLLRQIISSL